MKLGKRGILVSLICALIFASVFAVTTTTTVHAAPLPKQTIYVDTSAIDSRTDLTDLQKAALKGYILGDITGNFGVKVGFDKVEVTNDPAKKAAADRIVDIKAGRDPSPSPAWGDWPYGSKSVNVYLGEFMDDPDVADAFKTGGNWDTDKLGRAIGHTSGHEVGHSYSIGHNNETGVDRSKMTKGNNILAADRANTLFNFDEHSANVLKNNWGRPPCATAVDYDHKVLITHYWGEPDLPNKPCEFGASDFLFGFIGVSPWGYDFGLLGLDTDGGLYDGNSRYDFIYKSSMFDNDTDAQMISFFTGAQDYSQFVLRHRDSGQWYIIQEGNVVLDNFIANPDGLTVARLVTMSWPEIGIAISLDALAYGSDSNIYNGFTYEYVPAPDVVIFNVLPSKTVVGQDHSLNISVTIYIPSSNPAIIESVVSVNASTYLIEARLIFLLPRQSLTITFTWSTIGFAKGWYTISASAWLLVGGEPHPPTVLIDGGVLVTTLGDVNGDGSVDMADISLMIEWFMAGPPNWNPNCDINGDLSIDMADISIAIEHFMQT